MNCAGLHSDRLARAAGAELDARIVPFRGEYYELVPERRHLVKTLIYPVPNPAFPFLGVHFTKMIDGSVHAGPNAVLAFAREGYFKTTLKPRDLFETLTFGGFWRLAGKYWRDGAGEMWRSLVQGGLRAQPAGAGSRGAAADLAALRGRGAGPGADAAGRPGRRFPFVPGPRALHVCNAPSPAATASLEIGAAIAERVAAG